MFEYLRIEREDAVSKAAQQVADDGTTLAERAKEIQAEIRDVAGTRPWGDDSIGEAFLEQYKQVPAGFDKPFDELIDGQLDKAGKETQRLGTEIANAIVTYRATDVLGAKKVADASEEM